MSEVETRITRVPIPITLIRDMDAVILSGSSGYSTRAEFIVDAIQERILEVAGGKVEDAGVPEAIAVDDRHFEVRAANGPHPLMSPVAVQRSTLTAPLPGYVLSSSANNSLPEGMPLFGLHNRDYPSLWALARLASMASDRPLPAEDFYPAVIEEAWQFGDLLLAIEKRTGSKCTALFPTNPEKRKPAEAAFRSFAIGDYRPAASGFVTGGPLFEWRAIGLSDGGSGSPLVGITAAGWSLLEGVNGISVDEPHAISAAESFLAHLAENAPADLRGFTEIVRAIGSDGETRQGLLRRVAEAWPKWSTNEVSTNSAGYIARAREWGLVKPKQTKSRYHLTAFGLDYLNGATR